MVSSLSSRFNGQWNFPNCIGAIDGKYCQIQAPPLAGSELFNYKKNYRWLQSHQYFHWFKNLARSSSFKLFFVTLSSWHHVMRSTDFFMLMLVQPEDGQMEEHMISALSPMPLMLAHSMCPTMYWDRLICLYMYIIISIWWWKYDSVVGTAIYSPHTMVGDEAFPLKLLLMRPYPGRSLDSDKKRVYNYRLCRARRTIENAFGIATAECSLL